MLRESRRLSVGLALLALVLLPWALAHADPAGSCQQGEKCTASAFRATSSTNPIVVPADGEVCLDGTTCDYKIWYDSGAQRITLDEPNTTNKTYAPDGLQVANGLQVDSGGVTVTSSTVSSSAASGNNAFAVTINGARIDFGAGASDHCSSDGTTITCGPIAGVAQAIVFGGYSADLGEDVDWVHNRLELPAGSWRIDKVSFTHTTSGTAGNCILEIENETDVTTCTLTVTGDAAPGTHTETSECGLTVSDEDVIAINWSGASTCATPAQGNAVVTVD